MKNLFFMLSMAIVLSTAAKADVTEENQPTQNQMSVSVTETKMESLKASQFKHIVSVNFIPLIGLIRKSPGLGLGYQFILNDHYSIGSNVYYKKHVSADNYPDEVMLQYLNVGFEARYKLSSFLEDGFYGGIGIVSSGVQGDVEMKSIFGGRSEKAGTSYQWDNFVVPRIGYLWVPSSKRGYGDLSISYEPIEETEIEYGRGIENKQSATMEIKSRKAGANVTFVVGFVF
jgi:hypothetical protein